MIRMMVRKCLAMPVKLSTSSGQSTPALAQKRAAIEVLRWRSALDWTQAQAQDHLGVPLRTYQRWELGETPVPGWVLLKMARLSPVWARELVERAAKEESAA